MDIIDAIVSAPVPEANYAKSSFDEHEWPHHRAHSLTVLAELQADLAELEAKKEITQ